MKISNNTLEDMKDIDGVELFVAGSVVDSEGDINFYTLADLKEIAASYNIEKHEAPIVVGHDADKAWDKHLRSKYQLANGWVKRLYVENRSLFCDLEVDGWTYEAIKKKRLKKRSIAHYARNAPNNPDKGKLYLRHVALLGVDPPAVKTLKNIVLYKDMQADNAVLKEKAADWLAFSLIDSGNGFNGEIMAFSPEPTEENNWLYDAEKEQFAGRFSEDENQIFEFVIDKEGDDWVSKINLSAESAEAQEEEGEEFGEEEPMENESEELGETRIDPDAVIASEEYIELQKKLQYYEEKEKKERMKANMEFCDNMYDSHKLQPEQIKKECLYQIIDALDTLAGTLYYSESETEKVSVVDGLKKLLTNLPEQKKYSDAVYSRGGTAPIAEIVPYKNSTPESEKTYKEIRKYMAEHGIKKFGDAYREYNKKYKK